MYRFVALLAAGLALLVSPPALSAQGEHPPSVKLPAELDRILRDYERAWSSRDSKAVAELFAEDGFALPYGYGDTKGDMGKFVLALRRDPGARWLIAGDIDNASRRE